MRMKSNFTNQVWKHLLILVSVILFSGNMFANTKHIVEVTKNVFTPAELTIHPGDTVEWRNTDGFHNVNGSQATYSMNPESFGNNTGTGWTYSHVFTMSGKYDYQCDPHVGIGMVGTIEVSGMDDEKNILTVNFSGMNPHVGQTLWLSVTDKDSGKEIERKMETASVDFSIMVSGLEMDHSYQVDFFADHNGNGMYDAPPADHAWRMDLDNVMGDTTLDFSHNTNFTDINLSTGIEENLFTGNNLSVYPNPASQKVYVSLNNLDDSDFNIIIYNSAGIQLNNSPLKNANFPIEFDISAYKNGLYFIKIEPLQKSEVIKFIKK